VACAVRSVTSAAIFTVAEVKPHFGCVGVDGTSRVERYIEDLANNHTSIIASIQLQFAVHELENYSVFGSSCVREYADNVVVFLSKSEFAIVSPIGHTLVGEYAQMPFVADGKRPLKGNMCVSHLSEIEITGVRAYGGAVVRHQTSGQELCVVAGTLPHMDLGWGWHFVNDIAASCQGKPLLFVLDTNVWPDSQTFQQITSHHEVDWGSCSDPGSFGPATCCNDINKDMSYPTLRFDRTVMCRGGTVENFTVDDAFVCGTDEEHRYTKAVVKLLDVAVV